MRKILEIQKQLLPDLMDVLKTRYNILHQIMLSELIGKRTLAASLHMTERVLRAETDLLKAQGLIEIESSGMRISEAGRRLLEEMGPMAKELFGLNELSEKIRRTYGLRKVVVVPGDCEASPLTKRDLGREGAKALLGVMNQEDTIAVTGGSTLAAVAEELNPHASVLMKNSWFVPARGGLGESVEFQANTIASTMAKRVGAQYRIAACPRSAERRCLPIACAGPQYPGNRGRDPQVPHHHARHRRRDGDDPEKKAGSGRSGGDSAGRRGSGVIRLLF